MTPIIQILRKSFQNFSNIEFYNGFEVSFVYMQVKQMDEKRENSFQIVCPRDVCLLVLSKTEFFICYTQVVAYVMIWSVRWFAMLNEDCEIRCPRHRELKLLDQLLRITSDPQIEVLEEERFNVSGSA